MTKIQVQNFNLDELLVCPKCKGELDKNESSYQCLNCNLNYPILFGIPDFRLRSDRYLTLEEERDKASRLYEKSLSCSFIELVKYYYQITDDVPPELAERYLSYVLNTPTQAQLLIDELKPTKNTTLLDIGCGAGGLLVQSIGQYHAAIGVDIALRWLIIAKKRLDEAGINCRLICADAENLPFKEKSFDQVIASDLLEHVYDIKSALNEMSLQLKVDGKLSISAANQFFIGPNPSTRIWAVGFIPKSIRRWLLIKIRGVDSLRFINLVSPIQIKKILLSQMNLLESGPRKIALDSMVNYPSRDRFLISIYQKLSQYKIFKHCLFYLGPAFEMIFIKNKIK